MLLFSLVIVIFARISLAGSVCCGGTSKAVHGCINTGKAFLAVKQTDDGYMFFDGTKNKEFDSSFILINGMLEDSQGRPCGVDANKDLVCSHNSISDKQDPFQICQHQNMVVIVLGSDPKFYANEKDGQKRIHVVKTPNSRQRFIEAEVYEGHSYKRIKENEAGDNNGRQCGTAMRTYEMRTKCHDTLPQRFWEALSETEDSEKTIRSQPIPSKPSKTKERTKSIKCKPPKSTTYKTAKSTKCKPRKATVYKTGIPPVDIALPSNHRQRGKKDECDTCCGILAFCCI